MGKVKWTKEQMQAIEKTGNNILVAAAAGSGKTAVLVERIINKIINQKINIDEILVVTFTNAAAAEMRERILEAIYKKIEEDPQNIHLQKQTNLISRANISTIDSFCLEIVKNNFYKIDIAPNFRIADNAELELIKQETLEELFNEKYELEDEKFIKLLETYTTYSSDEPLRELIFSIYNFIQSHPFPMEWLEEKVEKYNLKDRLELDFAKTTWGEIIFVNLKEKITDSILKLEQIKKTTDRFDELKKYSLVLGQDIQELEKILEFNKWDEIYNWVNDIKFEKWPVDKKINLEEKEIAKEKRNEIRKQIKKDLEIIDCNSVEANKDILDMYGILKNLKEIILEYNEMLTKAKREKNIADFSDIEHLALQILLKKDENNEYVPTQTALQYKDKFKEIAIDEYQDSNLVQESILTSISNGENIFMVGDVKQSIYKFRQARPELFLEKYKKYVELEDENKEIIGNKIQLFKNFRSRENILDTTNMIFKNIMSRELGDIDYTKEEYLNLGANFEETERKSIKTNTEILIIENKDEDDTEEEKVENIEIEAKFVAKKIKEILESKEVVFDKNQGYRPITYKDIVILLRSTKDKANIFENELINLKIPVYSDTSTEYLNSIEIQTIMNLLKVIDNPTVDIPLVGVMRSVIGNFTDNELIKIRLENNQENFYEAMRKYNQEDAIKEKIDIFLKKIFSWKEEANYLQLDELIWKIYMDTGYYNYVSVMPDGILRQANLKLLFEKAKQYEKVSFKGLYNFINFIEKIRTSSNDLSAAKLIGENENVVRIMSIHKSKGLEFPLVFLCNSNKKFNVQDLNNKILLHQDLGLGANYIDSERKLEYNTLAKEAIKIKSIEEIISEEMRVLYVALTRAKERLIITGISKDFDTELKDKKELLNLYPEGDKINKNILKKYKSYLDWIELVCLKNDNTDIMNIKKIDKNKVLENISESKEEEENVILDDIFNNIEIKNKDEIKYKLDWKYKYLELSKIEGKTSVSKIKQASALEDKTEFKITSMKTPEFLKEKNNKLTGAQKGTLIHLCMQNLNVEEKYTKQNLEDMVENLLLKNKITNIEAENIDIDKILEFTKSSIWQEVRKAKIVEREKPFYIMVPANEIYNNDIEEEILVQGIIDLYYINEKDELILVDYKTDNVKEKTELKEKYSKQLELYKKALEEALNRKVDRTYIYSTCLNGSMII